MLKLTRLNKSCFSLATLLIACLPFSSLAMRNKAASGTTDDLKAIYSHGPHVGAINQVVVAVEVKNTSADGAVQEIRRGCGFVLRCDGFIAAPPALFSLSMTVAGQNETAGKQAVTVVFNPGSANEQRVAAHRPRVFRDEAGFVVLKAEGVHNPSMTSMTSDTLKPGDKVAIAWTAWNQTAKTYDKVNTIETAIGSKETATPSDSAAQTPIKIPFASPLPSVPDGSIVAIGNMAVGLVMDKGNGFYTFDNLNKATNCVTPVPTPSYSANQNNEQGDAIPDMPMVDVNGGPISMPPALLVEQPDMEGVTIACIAPFKIDKYEVTNSQYLAFWNSLSENERHRPSVRISYYPLSWSKNDPPFTPEEAHLPVLGVSQSGAAAYAKAQGKRLPTPYEWCAAAFGSDGLTKKPEWVDRYIGERNRTWDKIVQMHRNYLQAHPELASRGPNMLPYNIPWIAMLPAWTQAALFSRQTVLRETDALWAYWRDPPYILPVGTRSFDVGTCGAFDMIMNAAEIVASYPGPPARGGLRWMEVVWPRPARRTRDDEWDIWHIQEVMSDPPSLPPLSRLYRREYTSPSIELLSGWSGVVEEEAMLGAVAGWQLQMGNNLEAFAGSLPQNRNSIAITGNQMGYSIWQGMPAHYRTEMGLPVPFNEINRRVTTNPQLAYIRAVGFRCAR